MIGKQAGSKHWNWKGGIKQSNGYVYIYDPDSLMADQKGYVKRARLIAAEKIGRILAVYELVHHKDGDKMNDHSSNLEVTYRGKHITDHKTGLCLSDETRRKISASHRGKHRIFTQQHRLNLSRTAKERWRRFRDA